MFFIHQSICLSPQHTFGEIDLNAMELSENNRLTVKEPAYPGIPVAVLRRMGKAVRLGVGAGLALIGDGPQLDGIVIGTGNGGTEDCIKFLNQIEEYEEGRLTPTFFVQSSVNAVATQLAFLTNNKGYNTTHVHRGLAFETAVLDVEMLLNEHPTRAYLLGGVDEVSDFNYRLEDFGGWYKKEMVSNNELYHHGDTPGSIAGEGSAMFVVNRVEDSAIAQLMGLEIFHTQDEGEVGQRLLQFLEKQGVEPQGIDILVSGESGDSRQAKFYGKVEDLLAKATVSRFKHFTGEYQTA
ncbi:MAG: beta-ketoacyl synthase chain length factor, partial [Cytophagales bacterium]|nr:beta-ketoacyl synthase chain length factor [Cytophagales bacterium]